MINVYLCEDNKQQMSYYAGKLQEAALKTQGRVRFCYAAEEPCELWEYLGQAEAEGDLSVFFLDICFEEGSMDGLELAKKLRIRYPDAELIFLTSEAGIAYKTYEYQLSALDYIVKDPSDLLGKGTEFEKRVSNVFTRIIEKERRMDRKSPVVSLQIGNHYCCIHMDDICYVNAVKERHRIEIILKDRKLTAGISLSELKGQLGEEFWYCNKSCIVNTSKIQEVDARERILRLKDGKTCEIAFREIKKFKGLFDHR